MDKDNRRTECKNLIIITGVSCQGKTYIAMELKKRFGYYVIHTDWFYHPLEGKSVNGYVGGESEEKNEAIKEQKHLLTETTIIEGSHIGSKEELSIFVRELGFSGNIYIFKIESENIKEWFQNKHPEKTEEVWNRINSWFNKIYNVNGNVVSTVEEIINILGIDEYGDICISR